MEKLEQTLERMIFAARWLLAPLYVGLLLALLPILYRFFQAFWHMITQVQDATTAEVIAEVLNEYKKIGKEFKYCCSIYPTAPFITNGKLKDAYEKLVQTGADSVVPVVKFGFPIQRAFKIEEGLVKMNWPEYMNSRSQDLPFAYHDCGQFYFIKVESFLKNKKLFTEFTVPFEMPESEVQDIDNEEDWKVAEIKYQLIHKI